MDQLEASSSSPSTYTYDVFLSFRGVDTRHGFTGNLYSALSKRGVLTFMDDGSLKKGEQITPSLLNAIQRSRMAIVIFSKNYASSTFCLNELVQILECSKKLHMEIWPVFYHVDPSEVRYQKGSYKKAFSKLEQGRFKDDMEKVQKWRWSLREVAELSGSHFKLGEEYEHVFISKITEEVSWKLNRHLLSIADYPVGLHDRIEYVQCLLDAGSRNEVNVLGIYGMGGVGKSTISRAIYNLIAYRFESSCFLANVREKSTKHGLEHIQETMLSELSGERNMKLGDVYQGIQILKERLHRKKILLILDDIDKKEQLQATAGGLDWFGFGSIIIITTRDKHLLDVHGVNNHYKVGRLDDVEACKLLMWNAFKSQLADQRYFELVERVIYYANGLPLALERIGSNLFGKTLDEWTSALREYERIPQRDVLAILKVSYDDLEEKEKEIFLDIVCFFKGCTVRYITSMLHARGFDAKYGISVLEKKSLIDIQRSDDEFGEDIVTMHDLIQYMGKEIVRQQLALPQKGKRLWLYEDIIRVLEKNKENDEIEAIMLDMPEDKEFKWSQEVFWKMENLKMLLKKNFCSFRSPIQLPNSLKVLEWWGYPSASLVSTYLSENLVLLNLSYSNFQWDEPLERSMVLSHLILASCQNIRQIPDVSGFPNLIELCVDDCMNLIEIHDSVGCLEKLQRFSAKGCTKLKNGPSNMKLTSLVYLCLRDCSSLVIFPEILEPMEKLEFVDLEGTSPKNLPPSMQNLGGLQKLHLVRFIMLESDAQSNIFKMFANCFPFLRELDLQGTNLTILPACIEEFGFLSKLNVSKCKQLREIRGLPESTNILFANECTSLEAHFSTLMTFLHSQALRSRRNNFFILPGKEIPEWSDHISRESSLHFWFRKEFPSLIVCAVLGVWDNVPSSFCAHYKFGIKVNDDYIPVFQEKFKFERDHLFMLSYHANLDKLKQHARLHPKNEWNYGEVSVLQLAESGCSASIKWTGIYVNRTLSDVDNVRFTYPYSYLDTGKQLMWLSEASELPQHSPFSPANPKGSEFPKYTQDLPLMLPLPEHVVSNSDRMEPAQSIDGSSDIVGAFLDYPTEVIERESSQASGFAQAQNIQSSNYTSSSGQVKPELHVWTSSTLLPTTNDISLGSQSDDVEMEAFYDSFDAEACVVPRDESEFTAAPSEKAREALKIIHDFISNHASVLLHPDLCNIMKTSLDYLSNLSDDMSTEMRALISEASMKFTRWSRDYIEASMKIVSVASQLQRADELETSLESNKKKFRETLVLENWLLDELAWMEKRKEDLEGHINVIKAKISSLESKKNMARKSKRDIFEEGKMLKNQRDELRVKASHLQQEQGLAMQRQIKIEDEWSELREKFKKFIVE